MMSWATNIQKALSKIELASTSKVYTPFTLFCVFFAIYFNSEVLGQVFLSGKWEIQKEGLKTIGSKGSSEWFYFLFRVFSYGAVATLLYGLAQAISGSFWLLTTKLNIGLACLLDRTGYVSVEVESDLKKRLAEQMGKEKHLYEELEEYSGWSPTNIKELEGKVESLKKQKNDTHQKILRLESEIKDVTQNNEDGERSLKRAQVIGSYYRGLSAATTDFYRSKEKGIDHISGYSPIVNGSLIDIENKASRILENSKLGAFSLNLVDQPVAGGYVLAMLSLSGLIRVALDDIDESLTIKYEPYEGSKDGIQNFLYDDNILF